jgi:arsenate reductase
MSKTYNVLFLCTGNSARSIIAEALLRRVGQGRFNAFSAGSFPKGQVNPHALEVVEGMGFAADSFRSKSWDEFAKPGAPELDFIITVCDNAAGEVCPIWPGHPTTAHWGVPDPAEVIGSEAEVALAFADATRRLLKRISLFVDLPIETLDKARLQERLREIGMTADEPATQA